MSGVIENFLLVGIQAAILIIATLIFRRVLKNTPKVFVYAMWMVVLLRLCVPITTESRLGLIDRQEIKPVVENTESLDTPEFMEDNNENIVENPTITVPSVPEKQPVKLIEQLSNLEESKNTDEIKANKPEIKLDRNQIILICWIVGAVAVLLVALVHFVQIKRKIRFAINTKENIWETDAIKTAFVMGVINNKIYLPVGLSLNEREMILKHERTHIRHKDPIVRIVMLIVNVVYWWNPFVWLAVWFMKKDMEMFCDEAVVRGMADYERKDYLNVLLNHSARNSGIYPVMSFGETNTEKRIEHILNMKGKSAKTLIAAMCFMVIGLVGCTTVAKHQLPENGNTESSAENPTTENIGKEEQTTQSETESSTEATVIVPKDGVYISEDSENPIFITIDGSRVEIWDTSKFDSGHMPEHYVGRTDYAYYMEEWGNNAFEILGITAISDSIIEYNGVEYTFDRGALYESGGDYTINHTGYPQYDEIIDEIVDLRINGEASFGVLSINNFSKVWASWYMFHHGGFYLIDLDNNGTPEMFLGNNGVGAWQGRIFEVYTIKDGQAIKLLDGGERFSSLLCSDYTIYFDSSGGAAYNEMCFYKIENGELVLDVGLIYDGNVWSGDPDNPWNLCEDELSKDKAVPITGEEAWALINSYTTIPIEFTHFCRP